MQIQKKPPKNKPFAQAASAEAKPAWLRPGWIAALVFAAMTCLVFWRGFFNPNDIMHEDLAVVFQPYYTFANTEIAAGHFPLWNPYVCMGIPFHASLQPSLLYPLRWPMFFMGYASGVVVLLMVHYFLTALAGYHLLRGTLKVGAAAATLGALSIAFGGFALGHQTHLPYVMSYPWFLLAILFAWRAMQQWRWSDVAWGGVCIGLMGLIGAVHLLLVLVILLGTLAAYRLVVDLIHTVRTSARQWLRPARAPLALAATAVLSLLISAGQLAPAWAETRRSTRQQVDWRWNNQACAHPIHNTLQMMAPFYFGNYRLGYWGEYVYNDAVHYVGIIPLMAAAAGLGYIGRRRGLGFWLVLGLLGFVVGAGWYLPVYRILFDHFPLFAKLRNPTRLFWCTDIALAALGAVGLDGLLNATPDDRRRRFALLGAIAAGAAILVVTALALVDLNRSAARPERLLQFLSRQPNMNFPSQRQAAQLMPARVVRGFDRPTWIGIAAAAAGIALLAVVALRRQKAGRLAIALLGGILMLDLLMVSLGQATYDPHTGMLVGRPPEVRWLDQHLGSQRFGLHTLVNAAPGPYDQLEDCRAMLFGLSNAGGMPCGNATYPGRDVFCIAAHCIPPVTALAGIKYVLYSPVIGKLTDPAYLEVAHDERYTFYEYQHEAPLAFFVGQLQSVPDSKTALNMLCNGQADPKTVALLEGPLPDPAPQPAAAPARVVSTKRLPGRWHIGTDTGAPAQLVISEGYAPGWRCRVDDRPVNVFRTDAEILSVPVPAGRHTVVLWYSPPEFWYGLALTGLGILIAAAILAGPRLRLDRLWRRSQAPG